MTRFYEEFMPFLEYSVCWNCQYWNKKENRCKQKLHVSYYPYIGTGGCSGAEMPRLNKSQVFDFAEKFLVMILKRETTYYIRRVFEKLKKGDLYFNVGNSLVGNINSVFRVHVDRLPKQKDFIRLYFLKEIRKFLSKVEKCPHCGEEFKRLKRHEPFCKKKKRTSILSKIRRSGYSSSWGSDTTTSGGWY